VDATADEHELAMMTGFAAEQVAEMLDRLAMLGAVEYAAEHGAPLEAPRPDGGHAPRAPAQPRQTRARTVPAPGPPAPPPEEDVEIDPERRRRIADLFARLAHLTHYELLGVDERAGTKEIKTAFHAIAAEFHPDRHFRKRLGPYKLKIEAIFSRITLAHDVLVSARRAEYDAALARIGYVSPEPQAAPAPRAAPAPVAVDTAHPGSPEAPGQEKVLVRRRVLARKLSGTYARMTPPVGMELPLPQMEPEMAQRAAEAVRAHHERAAAEARAVRIARGIEQGRSALARGDFETAVEAFRGAASHAPDDRSLQETCDEGIRQAQRALADIYWEQAQVEEREARWEAAARWYAGVCAGRPGDALAHERAANAWLRSGSVRRAVELARKAIELEPGSAIFRITLARTYAAAGLDTSFHGELDRAMELAPGDPRVVGLVSRLRGLVQRTGRAS
jgi:curved DNA-binding protein CbpA